MKRCIACKELKLKSAFTKNKSQKDGLSYYCKECARKMWKTYYHSHTKKILESNRRYCQDNPEKNKEFNKRSSIRARQYYKINPRVYLLQRAKDNARAKKIKFNLTLEDIIIPEYCPYLNVKLGNVLSRSLYAPSIDRIDNSKDYIKGNVQIISDLANRMKSSASIEQLRAFSEGIKRMHGEK
jgi:hypothetical protein